MKKCYYFFSQKAADHYAHLNNTGWDRKIQKNTINGVPYTEMRSDGVDVPFVKWTDWKLVGESFDYKGIKSNGYW